MVGLGRRLIKLQIFLIAPGAANVCWNFCQQIQLAVSNAKIFHLAQGFLAQSFIAHNAVNCFIGRKLELRFYKQGKKGSRLKPGQK